jgi:hypothetical protein
MLSQEKLKAMFAHDLLTGALIWRHRPVTDFKSDDIARSWNERFAGTEAGSVNSRGYVRVRIGMSSYLVHRVVWMMANGSLPDVLDHINGIRTDNRLENLRPSTALQNARHMRVGPTGGSICVGVVKRGRKWMAYIGDGGPNKHLGYFASRHEAIAIRKCAEIARGYDRNHGLRAGESPVTSPNH